MGFPVGIVVGFILGAGLVTSTILEKPLTMEEVDKCRSQEGTSIVVISEDTLNCYTPAGKLEMERK